MARSGIVRRSTYVSACALAVIALWAPTAGAFSSGLLFLTDDRIAPIGPFALRLEPDADGAVVALPSHADLSFVFEGPAAVDTVLPGPWAVRVDGAWGFNCLVGRIGHITQAGRFVPADAGPGGTAMLLPGEVHRLGADVPLPAASSPALQLGHVCRTPGEVDTGPDPADHTTGASWLHQGAAASSGPPVPVPEMVAWLVLASGVALGAAVILRSRSSDPKE